jgi:hypothetical protein
MLLIILLSLIHLPSWWWGQGWAAATHVVYKENQKRNGVHVGTYTPLLQLLIQNVLTYFSLVF